MPLPEWVGKMTVLECNPDVQEFKECGVVFSGLDEKVGEIGTSLSGPAGCALAHSAQVWRSSCGRTRTE
jgi:hypothetical protein